jgi:hypothetical protein
MTPGRRRLAGVALLIAGSVALGLAAVSLGGFWRSDPDTALNGRAGSRIEEVESRLRAQNATQIETGPLRRIYQMAEMRVLLDVTPEGRVRQITLGHARGANETWEPDLVDWPLDAARTLSRSWLPLDATAIRTEPFVFRDTPAGSRDVYRSASLATVFPAPVYAAYNAAGPAGICAVTYYQTTSGGVAFFLVGLI